MIHTVNETQNAGKVQNQVHSIIVRPSAVYWQVLVFQLKRKLNSIIIKLINETQRSNQLNFDMKNGNNLHSSSKIAQPKNFGRCVFSKLFWLSG